MASTRLTRWLIVSGVILVTVASITVGDGRRSAPATTDLYCDPLPPGAIGRLGTVRFRPGTWISGAFSPDGKTLVTTYGDDRVCFWDMASGKRLRVLQVAEDGLQAISLSPDGKTLATGGNRGIDLWDVATQKSVQHFNSFASAMQFTPDGTKLVSGGNAVHVWDVATGEELRRLKPHRGGLNQLFVGPDNRTLVTVAHHDGPAYVSDLITGEQLCELGGGPFKDIYAAALTPDGKTLLLGGRYERQKEARILVFNIPNDKPVQSLVANEAVIDGLVVARDGRSFVSSDAAGDMVVWDFAIGKELRRWRGQPLARILSPDGHIVVGANVSGGIYFWDFASGKPLHVMDGHHGYIDRLAFSPGGEMLASTAWGETAGRLWDVKTRRQKSLLSNHEGRQVSARGVGFLPDASGVFTGGSDSFIRLTDTTSGKELRKFKLRGQQQVYSLSVSPDGERLTCSSATFELNSDDNVTVFDIQTGRELSWHEQKTIGHVYDGSNFSSDATRGVRLTGSDLTMYDVASGKMLMKFKVARQPMEPFAFSRDGKQLAVRIVTNLGDGPDTRLYTVRILEVATGKEQASLFVPSSGHALDFSPDGKCLAVAGHRSFTLHDIKTGKVIWCSFDARHRVSSLAFSPDGRTVATGLHDGSILLWDLSKPSPQTTHDGEASK
jgi:WD40 repeat protein